MILPRIRRCEGIGLLELLIEAGLLAFVILLMVDGASYMTHRVKASNDKTFAIQKAMQMLEELRTVSLRARTGLQVLDGYDDGAIDSPVLTTETADPADPLSGNDKGLFNRHITVQLVVGDIAARQVYVRVYRASDHEMLAETMSILRTRISRTCRRKCMTSTSWLSKIFRPGGAIPT
jgi:hypothetical protein